MHDADPDHVRAPGVPAARDGGRRVWVPGQGRARRASCRCHPTSVGGRACGRRRARRRRAARRREPPDATGTRGPRGGSRRRADHRDRPAPSPVGGDRPQLPVGGDRQGRGTQPDRGLARRARPRLAVAMKVKLYTIAASHPCEAVKAALKIKALPYREVELPPGAHRLHQRARFGRPTVPALIVDGAKVQGSRAIVRSIERLVSSPPLFPEDADDRAAVEVAEHWSDKFLQAAVRRIELAALRRCPGCRLSIAEASRWRGPEPNAADLQIGSSVRLLATFADLAPALTDRPVLALALRLFPDYPGDCPAGVL